MKEILIDLLAAAIGAVVTLYPFYIMLNWY